MRNSLRIKISVHISLLVIVLLFTKTAWTQLLQDSDGDGVFDDVDLCPETTAGEAIDEQGCSNTDYKARDRAALVALYNATNGNAWTDNTAWLTDEDHCAWSGLTCNESGLVTRLSLGRNGLNGSIPGELGNLASLQILELFGNGLSGNIPAELGNLTNLTTLWLSSNQLSASIPAELANLANLTRLLLYANQLSGSIPAELGNLTNLTVLDLSANRLTGSIPSELGKLASLTLLNLGSNELSGSISSELGNLTNLTTLWLSSNQLSGSIPSELANLGSMTSLLLYSNQLSGSIPAELGNLANVTLLDVSANGLSGSIPAELGDLTNLTLLNVSSNQLSGRIPPELGKLTNLTVLSLGSNHLSNGIPLELGQLTNLALLSLFSNQLSGNIPTELSNLNNLTRLDLSSNQLSGVISEGLGSFISNINSFFLAANTFDCPYPSALVNYFASINEPCSITTPSAVSIDRFDYEDSSITLFVSGSDGGATITSYTAICTSGDTSVSETSTTNRIKFTGLSNGAAYTCAVSATNAVGTSESSLPSSPITPEELPTGLPIWLLKEAADRAASQIN